MCSFFNYFGWVFLFFKSDEFVYTFDEMDFSNWGKICRSNTEMHFENKELISKLLFFKS